MNEWINEGKFWGDVSVGILMTTESQHEAYDTLNLLAWAKSEDQMWHSDVVAEGTLNIQQGALVQCSHC
jgi:hypothetical protein